MADAGRPLDRRALGASVEAAARAYLLRAGLHEVAMNANFRGGELDLVMLEDADPAEGRLHAGPSGDGTRGNVRHNGATLVFVEVRYRRDARFGGGAASIDAGKCRKLVHAAQCFLQMHRQFATARCRFDVIDASGDPQRPAIVWMRDAFRADDF